MTTELSTPDDSVTLVTAEGGVYEVWFNTFHQRWSVCFFPSWDAYRSPYYRAVEVVG